MMYRLVFQMFTPHTNLSMGRVLAVWYHQGQEFLGSVRSFATRASYRVSLFLGCVVVCKGPMFDFYVFRYSGAVLVL